MPRWITSRMLLPLVCCVGGCYHRQLLPATTICVRDQENRPVAGLKGNWSAHASEGDVSDQEFAFDADGCARIPRYDLQTNVLSFVAAAFTSLLPTHLQLGNGATLRHTTTDVRVSLPEAYAVDEAASGLKRTGSNVSGGGPEWEGRDDMDFHLYVREAPFFLRNGKKVPAFPGTPKPPDEFVIRLSKPESQPAVEVRLILQRKSAALPTNRP